MSPTAGTANASPAHPATTYNCLAPHCYSGSEWQYLNDGGFNEQTVPNLDCTEAGCTNGDGDFIDNEMWVGDNGSWAINQCNYPGYAQGIGCWVEAGLWTYYNGHGLVIAFFWADMRPCGGKFNTHVGPTVSSSLVGQIVQYTIQATSISQTDTCNDSANNTCQANIFSWPNGGVTQMNGYSTYVPIAPNYITVGGEVQGTTGGEHEEARTRLMYNTKGVCGTPSAWVIAETRRHPSPATPSRPIGTQMAVLARATRR